jgi:hypothetical protein
MKAIRLQAWTMSTLLICLTACAVPGPITRLYQGTRKQPEEVSQLSSWGVTVTRVDGKGPDPARPATAFPGMVEMPPGHHYFQVKAYFVRSDRVRVEQSGATTAGRIAAGLALALIGIDAPVYRYKNTRSERSKVYSFSHRMEAGHRYFVVTLKRSPEPPDAVKADRKLLRRFQRAHRVIGVVRPFDGESVHFFYRDTFGMRGVTRESKPADIYFIDETERDAILADPTRSDTPVGRG